MEETPDLSKIFELANMLKNANSSTQAGQTMNQDSSTNSIFQNSQQTNNTFEMPDMETIMKISKIIKTLNSNENNASTTLLYSLKPFLRKSKQDKIEQYAKILKLSSIISEFNKGNSNDTKLF